MTYKIMFLDSYRGYSSTSTTYSEDQKVIYMDESTRILCIRAAQHKYCLDRWDAALQMENRGSP